MMSSGVVTVETYLCWTLMGKGPQEEFLDTNLTPTVISLFVNEAEIPNIWILDLIRIMHPIKEKSNSVIDLLADDKSPLADNFYLTKKRLDYTTSKLITMNFHQKYDSILLNRLDEARIEIPKTEVNSYGKYLPHHAFIKANSNSLQYLLVLGLMLQPT
ncbi:hypothetical protein AVEN_112282-1 [Araneus ventricosus]|uniref:Uncharacterized protein n=1 Tax=Araneus ventricosus TaxID=182803 RepID=A0A4Y2H4U4_ARAVE|nr:hypothetical protein AVEN_112282-1 [Araneus ventricosus]